MQVAWYISGPEHVRPMLWGTIRLVWPSAKDSQATIFRLFQHESFRAYFCHSLCWALEMQRCSPYWVQPFNATPLHSSTEHCNRGASSCFGGTAEGVTVYFFTSKPLPGLASMAVEDPAARLWQFRSGNRPQSALHGPGRFSTKERTQEWPFLKVVREHPVLCSV